MQAGISQLILPNLTNEECLKTAAHSGYKVVELSLKRDGALTPEISDSEIENIVALADELCLSIVSLALNHCSGNLLEKGESADRAIQETAHGIEIAKKLGASNVLHTLG